MSENAPESKGLPDFSKKVGPLPTWGWAVIVVAAYLAYRHYAVSKANAAAAAATADATAITDPTALVDGNSLGGSGSGGYAPGSVTDMNTGLSGTPTNQSWGLSAIQQLIAGGANGADATTAIVDYLSGTPLTTAQQTIVGTALGSYGPPPIPVPVIGVSPVAPLTGETTPTGPVQPVQPDPPAPTPVPTPVVITPPPAPTPVPAPPTGPTAAQVAAKERAKAIAKTAYDKAIQNKASAAVIKKLYNAYWAAANKPAIEY
jgi:hypothetical protein